MDSLFREYEALHPDCRLIGLEKQDDIPCFCTPLGARSIGCDNGIQYCFIQGFGDRVFCVNPDCDLDCPVYPIADSFRDFLSLILSTGHTNVLQQIIGWDRATYEQFAISPQEQACRSRPDVQALLNTLHTELGIDAMEDPFETVKAVQSRFDGQSLVFSDACYEAKGLRRTTEQNRRFQELPLRPQSSVLRRWNSEDTGDQEVR